jgi:hypothetical protein
MVNKLILERENQSVCQQDSLSEKKENLSEGKEKNDSIKVKFSVLPQGIILGLLLVLECVHV